MPALFCLQQYDQITPKKQREFQQFEENSLWGAPDQVQTCSGGLYEDKILSVFQCHLSFFLCRNMIRFYLKQRKLQQLIDDFRSKFSAPQHLMKLVFVLRPWTNLFLKSLVNYSFFNLVFLLGLVFFAAAFKMLFFIFFLTSFEQALQLFPEKFLIC